MRAFRRSVVSQWSHEHPDQDYDAHFEAVREEADTRRKERRDYVEAYLRQRRARFQAGDCEVPHASAFSYRVYGCRCALCREAHRVKTRLERARRAVAA